MVGIIISILKFILILIIVILAVIGLALAAILLVPVRYSADAELSDQRKGYVSGKAGVSWLFRFVQVCLAYDGGLTVQARVLSFVLYDTGKAGKEPGAPGDSETPGKTGKHDDTAPRDEVDATPQSEEDIKSLEGARNTSVEAEKEERHDREAGARPDKETPGPEAGNITSEANGEPEESENGGEDSKSREGDRGKKRKGIVDTYIDLKDNLAGTKVSAQEKFEEAREIYRKIQSFAADEGNRKLISLLSAQIKKLLRHVLPQDISGRLQFGFDDPYTTGQVITALSLFYAVYARSVSFEPVFDRKVLEGELHIKGRIRLITVIWIALRLLLDRNTIRFIKKYRGK